MATGSGTPAAYTEDMPPQCSDLELHLVPAGAGVVATSEGTAVLSTAADRGHHACPRIGRIASKGRH